MTTDPILEAADVPAYDPRKHLMSIQGKPYLKTASRIDWLNETESSYDIETEHISITDTHAVFRCRVKIMDANGVIVKAATGYGSESKGDFGDFIEKAETKALGRALGKLGFGTPEDDGATVGRPVDAPRDFPNPAEGERCPMGHRMRDGPYGLNCTGKLPDGTWHNWKPVPPREPGPPPPPRPTKAVLAAEAKASLAAVASRFSEPSLEQREVWERVKSWAAERGTDPQRLRYYLATPAGVPDRVTPAAFAAWLAVEGTERNLEDLFNLYVAGEGASEQGGLGL